MAKCIICNSSHFKRIPQQHCPSHQDQCQHMYTYKKNWLVVSITFIVSCQTFFLRWQLLDLDNSLHVKAIAINPNKILKSEPKHATKCHSSNVADGSIIWHTISSFPQSLSFPQKRKFSPETCDGVLMQSCGIFPNVCNDVIFTDCLPDYH